MGVQINASTALVNFAVNNNASIVGLTQKTFLVWFTPVHSANGSTLTVLVQQAGPGTNENIFITYNANSTPGRVLFGSSWSTSFGQWRPTSALTTDGVPNHIAVTYDAGLTTNDPVIYLNGSSVAITEAATPAGTWRSGTNSEFYIGTFLASTPSCTVHSLCYYNRILSASEIADAYASKLAIPTRKGLVFAPHLSYAKNVQDFNGATLGATNLLYDLVSGAVGTPSGSPIGRADTYLNFEGI
jgi:hypothetical protein